MNLNSVKRFQRISADTCEKNGLKCETQEQVKKNTLRTEKLLISIKSHDIDYGLIAVVVETISCSLASFTIKNI